MAFTKQLYPAFRTEAELYDHFGLLTSKTILAHAIYPEDSEIVRIAEIGCGIAHCPIPNISMGTFMVAPVREYLRRGIAVGLGTDSGGGYSSSMLEVMKAAFMVSTARHTLTEGKDEILSLDEGFYLSTVGGARVLGLDDRIGRFAVGMEFDACLVDASVEGGVMAPIETEDGIRGVWEKWLMTGDDRNIVRVWVKGRMVKNVVY
jgi:guanine deaminase